MPGPMRIHRLSVVARKGILAGAVGRLRTIRSAGN
jgi:hypothetical protein